MAVPKRKTSAQRKHKRRSSVWKLSAPALTACPKCGEKIQPHHVCPHCGNYDGREVIAVEEK